MRVKENINYYIIAAVAVSATGIFLRYLYTLFPGVFTGIFSSSNGSMFEQMKMLLWPTVLFMAIHESLFKRGDFEGQSIYLLISLIIIPGVIFPLSRVFPDSLSTVNLCAVNLGVTVFFTLCYAGRKKAQPQSVFEKIAAPILMIAIITVFVAFSFNPPKSSFFADPNTGDYGMVRALHLSDKQTW